jgi:transposase
LFADESEALTHPYLARAWAKKGADLRVPAPGQAAKVAMIGSWDFGARTLIVHSSRTKRSTDFIAHLEQLDQLHGPKPGALSITPTVIVLDNGPIHTSKASLAQLQARSHWLTVEWLPKYAPELNDIEIVWGQMKKAQLAHQTFPSAEDLDRAIHVAVKAMNQRPSRLPLVNLRIPA